MAYHTGMYLFLFLPAVLLLYQAAPARHRWKVLLLAGYVFFYLVSGKLLLYLLGTTLFTHYIGLRLEALQSAGRGKKEQKRVLAFGICVLLAVLGYLKYYNFFAENLNKRWYILAGVRCLRPGTSCCPSGFLFIRCRLSGIWPTSTGRRSRPGSPWGKWRSFLAFFRRSWKAPSVCTARRQISSGRAETSEEKICPGDGFGLSGDCLRKWWSRTGCMCSSRMCSASTAGTAESLWPWRPWPIQCSFTWSFPGVWIL